MQTTEGKLSFAMSVSFKESIFLAPNIPPVSAIEAIAFSPVKSHVLIYNFTFLIHILDYQSITTSYSALCFYRMTLYIINNNFFWQLQLSKIGTRFGSNCFI